MGNSRGEWEYGGNELRWGWGVGGKEEHDSDKREKKIQLTDQSEMPAAGAAAAGQEVTHVSILTWLRPLNHLFSD